MKRYQNKYNSPFRKATEELRLAWAHYYVSGMILKEKQNKVYWDGFLLFIFYFNERIKSLLT